MKKALITGITGQDGSYLAELLLGKGYEVHGLIRRASTFNTLRIDHLYQDPHESDARLFLHYGDLSDGARLVTLMAEIRPDEVYNLAAQSHVRVSFDEPEHTGDTTGVGAMRLLEAVRMTGVQCRYYQASSSEMFGATPPPQNEETPFYPRSPYGAAKVYAYWVTKNYREGYGMYAVNGILFNHESPRRGETFVTRKITRAVARIKAGVRRYPQLVQTSPDMEGVDIGKAALEFWQRKWSGESFMAIGMQDPVLGPAAMGWLNKQIRNCPPAMEVAEGGHFVQEHGEAIARAAVKHFDLG